MKKYSWQSHDDRYDWTRWFFSYNFYVILFHLVTIFRVFVIKYWYRLSHIKLINYHVTHQIILPLSKYYFIIQINSMLFNNPLSKHCCSVEIISFIESHWILLKSLMNITEAYIRIVIRNKSINILL